MYRAGVEQLLQTGGLRGVPEVPYLLEAACLCKVHHVRPVLLSAGCCLEQNGCFPVKAALQVQTACVKQLHRSWKSDWIACFIISRVLFLVKGQVVPL